MHSVVKVALVAVPAACLVAGIAYWESGKFERVVKAGTAWSLGDDDWKLLAEHPDDPRLQPVMATELDLAKLEPDCKLSVGKVDQHMGSILARQKTSDDKSLAAIAHLMTRCNEPKLLQWTTRPAADIVKALHDKEIPAEADGPPNVLADLLLRLEPKVDQNLIDVVLASVHTQPAAVDAFFTNGFPPDGAAFTTRGATVPPANDPRLTYGIRNWLWALRDAPSNVTYDQAGAMLRILDHVTAPKLDGKMLEAINGRGPTVVQLCQRLVGPNDVALVTEHMSDVEGRTACLGALSSAADAQAILDSAKGGLGNYDAEEKKAAWADEKASGLVAMGPKVFPVLDAALANPDLSIRNVAARAYAKIDRHRYAIAIAKAFRANTANFNDVALTEKLLTDPPLELDAWFAMFATAHEPTIRSVIKFVKDKAKPEEWVPQLFAGLTNQTSQNTGTIAGYTWLLGETDGIGPIVAAVLSHALTAAGAPEKVDWLTKLLALRTLAEKGTAHEAEAIEPFVKDTSTYEEVATKRNAKTDALIEEKRTTQPFNALAADALAKAKAR